MREAGISSRPRAGGRNLHFYEKYGYHKVNETYRSSSPTLIECENG